MSNTSIRKCGVAFLIALSWSCNGGGFSGKDGAGIKIGTGDTKSPEEEIAPQDEMQEQPADEEKTRETTLASDTISECAKALQGADVDVIRVVSNDTSIELKPDSIIYLQTGGNAQITLPAATVASIKGICIEGRGGSSVSINTSLNVGAMYIYGQGSPSVNVDFGATGSLKRITSDLAGSPALDVKGAKIDCAKIEFAKKGAATLMCNGQEY